jgi:hypothetical protein
MFTYYMMILFTDIIHSPEHRYNIGWVLIASQGITILVSLILVAIDSVKGC